MPWKLADVAHKTKKAKTPRLQRQWLDVANGELDRHGDERRAIMAANGVIAKAVKRAGHKRKGR